MADGLAARALSFGSVAATYDRYRPGPPMEAVEWLLPTPGGLVVDLAAGTGALTRQLEARADRVVALEPDVRMLEVLSCRSPQVPGALARGEALPVASGTVDALYVSSAWHWMDVGPTVAEIARVLKPGGWFGVIWNGADRSVPWVADLLGVGGIPAETLTQQVAWRRRIELPNGAPFGEPETWRFEWGLPVTMEELVGLSQTYSTAIVLGEEAQRGETERVRRVLEGEIPDRLPMRVLAWRAQRLAGR